MRSALARLRWAGIGVMWDAEDPAPAALTATVLPAPPQVSLTVVHVQAGGLVNFGGISPATIPAVPQRRAAIAAPITEGERQ